MTYYVYHIPGKKIGVTRDLQNRVTEQQGYESHEYEVLYEHEDIDFISKLEILILEFALNFFSYLISALSPFFFTSSTILNTLEFLRLIFFILKFKNLFNSLLNFLLLLFKLLIIYILCFGKFFTSR